MPLKPDEFEELAERINALAHTDERKYLSVDISTVSRNTYRCAVVRTGWLLPDGIESEEAYARTPVQALLNALRMFESASPATVQE